MAIPAVQAFEKSLGRRLAYSPALSAASHFERLLKASPEPLGRGTGTKPSSFEEVNPHLLDGKSVRVVKHPKLGEMVLGEGHAEYKQHPVVHEFKVTNPFESLHRMGWQMSQELNGMSADEQKEISSSYEHPEHPYHLAYHYKIGTELLDPKSKHFSAHLAKKAGGMSQARINDNISHLVIPANNQFRKWNELPKTVHEWFSGRLKDPKNKSTYASDLASMAGRSAAWIAGGNRYFHTMRGNAKSGVNMTDAHEFHGAASAFPLDKFSARRVAPGFHTAHVAGDHNVLATADFDAKGQPTWKPHEFWASDKSGESPMPGHITTAHDYVRHLHAAPVGDGRDAKNFGHLQVGLEYVTSAARNFVAKHIRIFGDSSRPKKTAAMPAPRPAAMPEAPKP